jgi:hypothetical protein
MSDILNYQLRKRWEIITCPSGGESCWCRGVILEGTSDRLDELDEDKNEKNFVVGYAELPKTLAEHFVQLHNDYVDKLELEKDGGF